MDNAEAGPSRPRQPPTTPKAQAHTSTQPDAQAQSHTRRRSWFNFGSPLPLPSAPHQTPTQPSSPSRRSSRKTSMPERGEELEMSLVSRPRLSAESAARSHLNNPGEMADLGTEGELLTIHGDLESTIKKKKKKKKPGDQEQDEGEVVRMMDLTSTRKPSGSSASTPLDRPFPTIISDRSPATLAPPIGTPRPFPNPSLGKRPSFQRIPSNPDKDHPPLPHLELDRPLPPLPPETESTPPPIIPPRSIVITPSSPRKASPEHSILDILPPSSFRHQVRAQEKRGSRSQPGSRSASRERKGTSPIGLGLPRQLHPDSPLEIAQTKTRSQTVSSPFPQRTPSPGSRIAFADPPQIAEQDIGQEEKRGRVKRARSLSGIFSKAAVSPADSAKGSPGDQVEPETRSGGVLEWLGVRKVKRRQSEARLEKSTPPTDSRAASTDDPHTQTTPGNEPTPDDDTPTPSVRSSSAAPSKLANLFSRKHSKSKEPMDSSFNLESSPTSPAHDDAPSSSRSSIALPAPISSLYSGPLFASPQVEYEEMLFSPSSINWGPGVRPWMDGTDQRPLTSLGPLPEQDLVPPTAAKEGRVRSWSDAPRPPPGLVTNTSNPHLPTTPSGDGVSSPSRPVIGSRSSTGNSAIISRIKTVFARSGSRPRANSALQPDTDEFGGLRQSGDSNLAPSSSSSPGRLSSPKLDRRLLPEEQSIPTIKSTTRPSTSSDAQRDRGTTRNRPRASTVSTGTRAFAPPSPSLFPLSATPPRRRPSMLHRVSNGLMGSSRPASPSPDSLFPLPPRSSGSVASLMTPSGWDEGSLSPGPSPRPSIGSASPKNELKQVAKRIGDETPTEYLERVTSTIGRADIANVIASSSDAFHTSVLNLYMERFDFARQPLDVALRRLLMYMPLPGETQQIDRVIEAFANRYEQCEPGLFQDKDNTYVLAFSMMMLHTDAFNRHNKNKMTKADYVRNTRMEGVPPLVLEAFFDNITFTPFVFIEDDADLKGDLDGPLPTMAPPKSGKIDVYHMIVNNLLSTLCVNIQHFIPDTSPFSCMPPTTFEGLHAAFVNARSVQVTIPGGRRKSSALPGKRSTTPLRGTPPVDITMRVAKSGVLSRKDDGGENKKSNRKWKTWSVVLTASQLMFFNDPLSAGKLLGLDGMTNSGTFKPDEVLLLKDCFAVHDLVTSSDGVFRLVLPHGRQYLIQAPNLHERQSWIDLINYASVYRSTGVRMRGSTMDKEQVVLAGAAAASSHRRNVAEVENNRNTATSLSSTSGSRTSGDLEIVTPKKVAIFGEGPSPIKTTKSSGKTPKKLLSSSVPLSIPFINADTEGDDHPRAVNENDESNQLEEVFEVVKAELAYSAYRSSAKSGARLAKPPPTQFPPRVSSRENGPVQTLGPDPSQGSRIRSIEHELERINQRIQDLSTATSASMRIVRNLALLTPFQKTTRDRVASSIQPLATRIRHDRLQLAKYELWQVVLQEDLLQEKVDWTEIKEVALEAATKSLVGGVPSVVREVNTREEGSDSPASNRVSTRQTPERDQLEIITTLDTAESKEPSPSPATTTGSSTPMIFNLSESEDDRPLRDVQAALERNVTVRGTSGEKGSRMEPGQGQGREQAEEWQNTKAAKRVSLAALQVTEGEMRKLSLRKKKSGEARDSSGQAA